MHATQKAYAAAKALFDTLKAQGTKSDAECERLVAAFEAMRGAEDAMIAWAHEIVQRHPQYRNHAADLQRVLSTRHHAIRPKVVDLAFRLGA
jgi:uncharacterized tellurite resistance protein B-like protein